MRKIIPFILSALGSLLFLMMQVGPDDVAQNVCKWMQIIRPTLSAVCLPGVDDFQLYLVAAILVVGGGTWLLWLYRKRLHLIEPWHIIALGALLIIAGLIWQQLVFIPRKNIADFSLFDPTASRAAAVSPMEGNPLAWQRSPYLGWQKQKDGRIEVRTVALRGKNIGTEEVQLVEAYIVSGITGKRLDMNIFARNPDGTGLMVAPRETNPIPPGANIQLSTEELNSTVGVPEADFLREWGTIFFTSEYGDKKHRITFDRKTMEALFEAERPPPTPPHVTKSKT